MVKTRIYHQWMRQQNSWTFSGADRRASWLFVWSDLRKQELFVTKGAVGLRGQELFVTAEREGGRPAYCREREGGRPA